MSKYILAGQSMADFINSKSKSTCFLVASQADSNTVQKMLLSMCSRKKTLFNLVFKTILGIDRETDKVLYTLLAIKENKKGD